MDVKGSKTINANPEKLWDALLDPQILQMCIPACQSVTGSPEAGFEAELSHNVKGLPLRLKCDLEVNQIAPHQQLELRAKGNNMLSRGASCSVDIALQAAGPGKTLLTYTARAEVNAPLRKALGQTLDELAGRGARAFVDRLARVTEDT